MLNFRQTIPQLHMQKSPPFNYWPGVNVVAVTNLMAAIGIGARHGHLHWVITLTIWGVALLIYVHSHSIYV